MTTSFPPALVTLVSLAEIPKALRSWMDVGGTALKCLTPKAQAGGLSLLIGEWELLAEAERILVAHLNPCLYRLNEEILARLPLARALAQLEENPQKQPEVRAALQQALENWIHDLTRFRPGGFCLEGTLKTAARNWPKLAEDAFSQMEDREANDGDSLSPDPLIVGRTAKSREAPGSQPLAPGALGVIKDLELAVGYRLDLRPLAALAAVGWWVVEVPGTWEAGKVHPYRTGDSPPLSPRVRGEERGGPRVRG
ncbi:MAG TPA: hypothetical protein EYP85_05895, partial [Armatimonadetes bacterium]|nr:hypothetical protein [Armatimonadota bacterium]